MRFLVFCLWMMVGGLCAETMLFPQNPTKTLKAPEFNFSANPLDAPPLSNPQEAPQQPIETPSEEVLQEIPQVLQQDMAQGATNTLESSVPLNLAVQTSIVKNVYLEALNLAFDVLYVHQIVPITLKMLIFSEYTTIQTDFIFENMVEESSVEVLNPKQNWIFNAEDSSFSNTFYFKIKQQNYTIPQIKVRVNTKDGEASESLASITGKAVVLDKKGNFSQVLAQKLEILDTKITSYDALHNLIVLQLQSTMGNLFDFHLSDFSQQGIESKSGDYQKAVAFYYVIAPKDENTLNFEYFNLTTSKYESLQVANLAIEDRVSTQSDVKPKNNYQFFKLSITLFFALVFFGLFLYKRRLIFILLGVFALSVLVYFLTLKTTATLKANASLSIQPTFNSTIIFTAKEPMRVAILGYRASYVKVMLEDERIGWVKKDDIQN